VNNKNTSPVKNILKRSIILIYFHKKNIFKKFRVAIMPVEYRPFGHKTITSE
jgi:hypothetical protein